MSEFPQKAAIVGGGPAGLAMGQALQHFGIDFEIIEQNDDFGGLWNRDWDKSPIYDSAHFISSRTMSHFAGYPMPSHWPDYPRHDQILEYTRSFAKETGMYDKARLGVEVTGASPADGGWTLTFGDGQTAQYRWLICANGATWDAAMPDLPGAFNGTIRHSRDYNSSDEFAEKRVLIVGAGNSGADIACDAAQRADHAGISMRRGYWFIPKHIEGIPGDVYGAAQPKIPLWLKQKILRKRLLKQIGDLTRLGLPMPDHELFETHPLLNDQILHYLRHGDLSVYKDIVKLDGDDVVFKDGVREAFDEIILATGYTWSAPFLPDDVNPFSGGRAELPLSMFPKNRDDLFFISFVKAAGCSITLFGEMAWIIARAMKAEGVEKQKFRDKIAKNDFDLRKGLKMVSTERNKAYINRDAYMAAFQKLRRHMGWPKDEAL